MRLLYKGWVQIWLLKYHASTTLDYQRLWKPIALHTMTTNLTVPPVVPSLTNADLELLVRFYQSLDAENQTRLCRLLQWALALPASQSASVKVVRRYAKQPEGYNHVPTLLVAPLQPNGVAVQNAWVLRIPLVCNADSPLRVTLPSRHKANTAQDAEIACGIDNNFRPLDIDDFLSLPQHYTKG